MDFQDCYVHGARLAWEAGQMTDMTNERLSESDEAVRILTELTGDFERFDSLIHEQRCILEQRAGRLRHGGDIERESERFRRAATEMAMRTQKALEQLSQLAEPGKPGRHLDLGREPAIVKTHKSI
jgi:hypothetical protein